ncbi:hypothetical protein MOQ_000032 [Trypanosoma cruzi marinkellei]|uniref:Uncharacterized protein n=1 Tax=Trypanosoma cruzi marinkellei TaxID=85056 RepID=K2NXD9_TRYCR|nr:hypothetical protein MOQ_000032 [Trypanosoma cruzi marinkellei]
MGTLSAAVALSNTTNTLNPATETSSSCVLTGISHLRSDFLRPNGLRVCMHSGEMLMTTHILSDHPTSPLEKRQQEEKEKKKRKKKKEEEEEKSDHHTYQGESSSVMPNGEVFGRLLSRVGSGSDMSNLGSRHEVTSAVFSWRWLLERNDVTSLNHELKSTISSGKRTDDRMLTPPRHIHTPRCAAGTGRMDDEALIAIDMLREWGEKEKEELFLRHPRLEAYTTRELHTPLSAVLTGFPLAGNSMNERNTRPVTLLAPLPPNPPSQGMTTTKKRHALASYPSSTDLGLLLNPRDSVERNYAPQLGKLLSGFIPEGRREPLEVASVHNTGDTPEEDDVLSRGLCGRGGPVMEDRRRVWPWRKGGKIEKRSLHLNDVLQECHFFGVTDIFEVLQDDCKGDGCEDVRLPNSHDNNEWNRSVISRVVALADRSLRRHAGKDEVEAISTDTDVNFSTTGKQAERNNNCLQASHMLVDSYQSAEDELACVVDLSRMAAECAELSLSSLTPSTETEVIT